MHCQIEFANDDVGMPCAKPAVAKCGDCVDLRSAMTAVWNAAAIPSAVSAMTIT